MAKMIITHDVEDVATWLTFKGERAGAIATMGGSQVVDYVAQDGSKTVAISADVEDVGSVLAVMASPPPELGEVMARHGVLAPMKIFVEG